VSDGRAERGRVRAEEGRVLAEGGRQHAEHAERGRVENEDARVKSEEKRRGSWIYRNNGAILGTLIGAVVFLVLVCAVGLYKVRSESGRLSGAIHANCTVLTVMLENRADRDTTEKLFAPIRAQNPEQFDRLVDRAERGDRKLVKVAPDLSCEIHPKVLRRLRD
jgi:hypothetical protein